MQKKPKQEVLVFVFIWYFLKKKKKQTNKKINFLRLNRHCKVLEADENSATVKTRSLKVDAHNI